VRSPVRASSSWIVQQGETFILAGAAEAKRFASDLVVFARGLGAPVEGGK